SILVLPLGDGSQPFGILEVFSSLLDAFGDQDVSSLRNLARRVAVPNVTNNLANAFCKNVGNLGEETTGAEEVIAVPSSVEEKWAAPESAPEIEQTTRPAPEPIEVAAAPAADE